MKHLLKIVLAVAVALSLTACGKGNTGAKVPNTTQFFAMDTYVSFTAYGEAGASALEDAKKRLLELEQLLSVTEKGSDIYAINHSGGQTVEVREETAQLLSFALSMAEKTGGALEPTVYPILTAWGFTTDESRIPSEEEIRRLLSAVGYDRVRLNGNKVRLEEGMMLDVGAIGKGYVGDVIIELLKERGITSAFLDIGGNIQTLGTKPDGSNWRLGLKSPFEEGNVGVLSVADLAVVTSGNYERYFIGEDGKRYGHIMNPKTGYPAESNLASATVIAAEGKLCDALSTSLFVMGLEKAEEYWREHQDFDMILITESREIYLTEGIEESFSAESNYVGKLNVIRE